MYTNDSYTSPFYSDDSSSMYSLGNVQDPAVKLAQPQGTSALHNYLMGLAMNAASTPKSGSAPTTTTGVSKSQYDAIHSEFATGDSANLRAIAAQSSTPATPPATSGSVAPDAASTSPINAAPAQNNSTPVPSGSGGAAAGPPSQKAPNQSGSDPWMGYFINPQNSALVLPQPSHSAY